MVSQVSFGYQNFKNLKISKIFAIAIILEIFYWLKLC
nr:MAG TPA: hypothetical protein [Bacteriophage sp.]